MGEDEGTDGAAVTGARDPTQIQREIEQTREELGDTVEALARKADAKAQAKQKVEETKESVSDKKEQLLGKAKGASPDRASDVGSQVAKKASENPIPFAAAGAFAAGFLAGWLTKH